MCFTQACAHARHPAPAETHSLQRLQGRVACQGLCKMLRTGIADVVRLKAAVSAQTSMSRTNWLFLQIARTVLQTAAKGTKRNYLSKPSHLSSVSLGSLRLRRSMASFNVSFTMLANHAPCKLHTQLCLLPDCIFRILICLIIVCTTKWFAVSWCHPHLPFPSHHDLRILLSPQ
jgi:hypothetical protein